MMKKILYIMNVEWNWIKQRPHFIAEILSETFDVFVIYQYRYRRTSLQKRENGNVNLIPIYLIPKISGSEKFSFVNERLLGIFIKHYIRRINPDIIYLTYPAHIYGIINTWKGKLIYDCMDNYSAFICNKNKKKSLIIQEKSLINRADIVFTSSRKLIDVQKKRYGKGVMDKIQLVRNGYSGKIINERTERKKKEDDKFTFTYFGTISNWFNFEYILKSLVDFSNIKYELFGPIDGVSIPEHDRIIYRGIIEHNKLFEKTYNADCFIMPFMINEITESVDPVKLYEYINFNKNILCSYYPEVERFRRYVYFYTDYNSYKEQIKKLIGKNIIKYSEKDRKDFLLANQWINRVKIITDTIMLEK